MIKTVLEKEPSSSFTLLYGNKSSEETMFKSELDELSGSYGGRFNLHYIFSRQKEEGSLFGRIDKGIQIIISKISIKIGHLQLLFYVAQKK